MWVGNFYSYMRVYYELRYGKKLEKNIQEKKCKGQKAKTKNIGKNQDQS
jgi:hypothetical protein